MGLNREFFAKGYAKHVVDHYIKALGSEIEVEATLYDGESFTVEVVQVFGDDLILQTEGGRLLVAVPASGIAKIKFRPRDAERSHQPGFRVETPDTTAES